MFANWRVLSQDRSKSFTEGFPVFRVVVIVMIQLEGGGDHLLRL